MKETSPTHEAIAERAYLLWEQAGRPQGRDQEFWLRAEAELAPSPATSSAPPVIAPPAEARLNNHSNGSTMKQNSTHKTKAKPKSPPNQPRPLSPRYHPATGQILSEVGEDSPYAQKKAIKKPRVLSEPD